MLDLDFRPKVLSLPKGRAQEYCLLAPAWTCLLCFRAGFRANLGPFRGLSWGLALASRGALERVGRRPK